MEGICSGMYVKHEAKDHDAWVGWKKNWKKGAKFNQPASSESMPLVIEHKLGLSTDLTAVMVTNFSVLRRK